ncbi:TRAP transporter small permease subunit [Kordiimonas sp. SCSIO 12610]|uniref:TRAP transporter small permease subunit n=1 Tax=Kordiimonas sp. SCSIO 12610 TaxID=2829597 RepID=UPI00210A4A3D|nr:TRAP transporter small permease subunit [Kordiimonas sp. SCSIO 12610]UTW54204.1 TRAP transporter small permease subunit [Kordiimonas sp. SCSIO 12610]
MDTLLSVSKKLNRIVTVLGKIGAWAIIGLMAIIIIDVTLRRWFVIGSTKLQELEWHLHGILFLMCLGWTYLKNGHVRIELVSERMTQRSQAWIELFGITLFLIPYVISIIVFGMDYVGFSYQFNEGSASPTGLPNRWIIKSFIIIGFIGLGLAALARLLDIIVFLFGNDEQRSQSIFASLSAKGAPTAAEQGGLS